MGELESWLNSPLIGALGRTGIDFVWQGLAVGLLLIGVEALGRPRSASGRYRLAGAALALLAALPAFTLWRPYGGEAAGPAAACRFSISPIRWRCGGKGPMTTLRCWVSMWLGQPFAVSTPIAPTSMG